MDLEEARKLTADSGGEVNEDTAKHLVELYSKNIEDYTREDFLDGSEPYDYIYLYRENKFQQNKLLRILKAPLQIARQADKGLAAEFLADSDGSFYIRLYSLPREIHADGPRLVQAAGRDGDARVG